MCGVEPFFDASSITIASTAVRIFWYLWNKILLELYPKVAIGMMLIKALLVSCGWKSWTKRLKILDRN